MSASAAQVQNRNAHAGQQATDGTPSVLRGTFRLAFWLFVALLFSIVIESEARIKIAFRYASWNRRCWIVSSPPPNILMGI